MTFKSQIEKGLRAQIKMQSLVTGQLMIYADYFPGKPLRLVKAEPRYPEIPTIPSGTEEIMKALEQSRCMRSPRKPPRPWTGSNA